MAPKKEWVTAVVLGEMLDMTERRVRQLTKEGIFQRPSGNGYPVIESVRSYIRWLKRSRGRGDEPVDDSIAGHKTRLVKAQASRAELELAEKEGMLVDAAAMDRAAFDFGRRVREAMLNIPPRIEAIVAAETDTSKVREILDTEIRGALTEFADKVENRDAAILH